jgi:hypothetical protein
MTAACAEPGPGLLSPTVLVKDDLARRPLAARCCTFAETAVMLRLAGQVRFEGGSTRLSAVLDHPGAARRLAIAVTTLLGSEPRVERTPGRVGTGSRWVVRIDTAAPALARKAGLCDGTGRAVSGIPQHVMVSAACCQVAAWRAAVLATGTMPTTGGERRLRVGCPDLQAAMSLAMLAGRIAARARVPAAGPPQVVIEVAGEVAAMLRAIGVGEATLETCAPPVGRPRPRAVS